MIDRDLHLEVQFGGQEGSLTLTFSPSDAVPAGVECDAIHIKLGPLDATITTVLGLDTIRVRDELQAALSSDELTGLAHFQSVEHDLSVAINLHYGKGTILMRVTTGFADLRGYAELQLTTDQSFLRGTLRQLDALITAFPRL